MRTTPALGEVTRVKLDFRHRKDFFFHNLIIKIKICNAKYPEQTYMDVMHQTFLLVDFVGFDAVLVCQSEDAVLSGSNVRST